MRRMPWIFSLELGSGRDHRVSSSQSSGLTLLSAPVGDPDYYW